jgi:hypothetical protein
MSKDTKTDAKQPELVRPYGRPITRRSSIKLGVLTLGVALPLITTLAPTEARAQSSSEG